MFHAGIMMKMLLYLLIATANHVHGEAVSSRDINDDVTAARLAIQQSLSHATSLRGGLNDFMMWDIRFLIPENYDQVIELMTTLGVDAGQLTLLQTNINNAMHSVTYSLLTNVGIIEDLQLEHDRSNYHLTTDLYKLPGDVQMMNYTHEVVQGALKALQRDVHFEISMNDDIVRQLIEGMTGPEVSQIDELLTWIDDDVAQLEQSAMNNNTRLQDAILDTGAALNLVIANLPLAVKQGRDLESDISAAQSALNISKSATSVLQASFQLLVTDILQDKVPEYFGYITWLLEYIGFSPADLSSLKTRMDSALAAMTTTATLNSVHVQELLAAQARADLNLSPEGSLTLLEEDVTNIQSRSSEVNVGQFNMIQISVGELQAVEEQLLSIVQYLTYREVDEIKYLWHDITNMIHVANYDNEDHMISTQVALHDVTLALDAVIANIP